MFLGRGVLGLSGAPQRPGWGRDLSRLCGQKQVGICCLEEDAFSEAGEGGALPTGLPMGRGKDTVRTGVTPLAACPTASGCDCIY